jgi:ankyrin repeat protein
MNVFDSFDFRDLIRAGLIQYTNEGDKDDNMIYLHILDCIGALSRIQKRRENIHLKTKKRNTNDQEAESNRRIFWQVVRELADRELPLADRKVSNSSEINSAQYSIVLDVFPDEAKRMDGRSWLPLHWAMSLPSTDIQDIENLIIAKPERLNILTDEFGYNPIHLVCLTNGRVDIVHLLMDHLPLGKRNVTTRYDGSTPLHLAVRSSSNSLAFVRELIRLCPSALEMGDSGQNTPLHCVSTVSSEGPQILQALLDAAPQTAQKKE